MHRNGYGNGESEYFSVGYSHHSCHNMDMEMLKVNTFL